LLPEVAFILEQAGFGVFVRCLLSQKQLDLILQVCFVLLRRLIKRLMGAKALGRLSLKALF
jgi:hypothetical protein